MMPFYVGATPGVERAALDVVCGMMAAEFDLPVREVRFPAVDFALDAHRGQYRSADVLEMAARLCPQDAWKLLALTGSDLFVPVLTFVFGQAQLDGRVGVVSLARLRQEFYGLAPNLEILLARTAKEALHEAGHMFGLVHCPDRACAMSLATNVRQIDGRQAAWCAGCAARLRHARGVMP